MTPLGDCLVHSVEVNTFVLEAGRWEASSFWNAVDLSVAGISVAYFILKFVQIRNDDA